MQESKANHTRSQRVPRFLDHGQAIIADAQATQAFQPTDGSFHDPPHLSKATTMFGSAPSNVRLDSQPGQQSSGAITVVATISIQFVRKLLRFSWLSTDLGKVQNDREDLPLITRVGGSRVNCQGHAMAIHHQCVFGAGFSAVHRARTRLFSPAKGTHDHAIDDDQVRIKFVFFAEQAQEIGMDAVPDAECFPSAQTAMGCPARAAQLRRHVLPATTGDQYEPYDLERHTVCDTRSAAIGADWLLRRKVMANQFIELIT